MALPPWTYEAVLLAAVVATAGFAGYAWRRRSEPGGRFVLVYAGAAVLWSAAEFAMSLTGPFGLKAAWFTLLFVGVIVTIPTWFLFVLVYTGRWAMVTRRTVTLVGVAPAVAVLLTVTNSLHGLMFDSLFPISTGAGLDMVPGPLFFAYAAYAGTLLVASVVLLLDTAARIPTYYWRQIALLSVGAVAPAFGSTFRMVGLSTVDLTPVGLVVSGVALSVAISREGFLDVSPVASDVVVDTMDAAVFVVDRQDRLVDANEAALSMLGEDRDVVGEPMAEVLGPYPAALERYREIVDAGTTQAELDMPGGVYDVTVSPLIDPKDRLLGRVILVADVTDRKRRERELERQNERLEEFSSVLSHDIRNPLTIADLHLELARDAGADADDHFEAIERSLGRMEDIVDDVLALAREGRTVTEDDLRSVSVAEAARRAWAGTPTGNARLDVDADRRIMADPKRLQRAFENLFRNAVEHGVERDPDAVEGRVEWDGGAPDRDRPTDASVDASGLTVRVGLVRAGGPDPGAGVELMGFFVEDDGRGIPADERETVLESGYSSRSDGTGFGLSIVQSIVEAHGWELAIAGSDAGGARFEVTGVEPADGRDDD